MKSFIKKSVLTLMLMMTFCLFSGMDAKAAGGVFSSTTVSDVDNDSATIKWGYTGSEHYFNIYLSLDGSNWAYKDYGMSGSEYLSSLAPNTTYFVRIEAANNSGEGKTPLAVSNVFSFTTAPNEPARVTGVAQTGATSNSITLAWAPSAGATGYEVSIYANGAYTPLAVIGTNSALIPNLAENTSYKFRVRSFAQNAGGTVYSSMHDNTYGTHKTTPAKIPMIAVTSIYSNINNITIDYTRVNADGYEIQVYNNKGKLANHGYSTFSYNTKLKKGIFYKYRVRPYVNIGTGKAFGPWSNYNFFGVPTKSTGKVSGRKIRYTWNKVAGATKYTVYISASSSSTGYKKVKSLKSNKRSITITKCGKKKLKKGKTYYVKVVVRGKSGKTKGTSKQFAYISPRISRY